MRWRHMASPSASRTLDLDKLRGFKSGVVKKLTSGLSVLAKQRKVEVVTRQRQAWSSPHVIEVDRPEGHRADPLRSLHHCGRVRGGEAARLARGSAHHRFDRRAGTAGRGRPHAGGRRRHHRPGDGLCLRCAGQQGQRGRADALSSCRDAIRIWSSRSRSACERATSRFCSRTKVTGVEATKKGLRVSFAGEKAPASRRLYDRVLVAVGRTPNGKLIGAEAAGVKVSDRGFIPVDKQMRTNVPHIFAIGDIVRPADAGAQGITRGQGRRGSGRRPQGAFDARAIPSVAYTDPEVAWAGLTETDAKAKGTPFKKGLFPWAASGRSLSLGRDEGFTKLLFDPDTHRMLGGGIVGPNAGT